MRLPDPIEIAIQQVEWELDSRLLVKAGPCRLRELRSAIQTVLQQLGITYKNWKEVASD